jgi:hypothetical protein
MSLGPVVCCVKWGTKYPPDYVNRLRSMVARHFPGPHEFVCLTEDAAGLDREIRTLSLPDHLTGFWNKISLFRRDLFEPGRTVIYLDLDLVIVGRLDFLLDRPGGFRFIGSWRRKRAMNSSVMRFQAGGQAHVYERFIERAEEIVSSGRYAGDQNWITEQIPDATFFPPGKIVSYKLDMPSHVLPLAKKLGLDFGFIKAPRFLTVAPPEGASIVVFHGKPDPEDVMDSPCGPWKRAPFIREHWR